MSSAINWLGRIPSSVANSLTVRAALSVMVFPVGLGVEGGRTGAEDGATTGGGGGATTGGLGAVGGATGLGGVGAAVGLGGGGVGVTTTGCLGGAGGAATGLGEA